MLSSHASPIWLSSLRPTCRLRHLAFLATRPLSHKSILDYLHNSGLSASYDALRSETHHDDFNPDPKSKHAGLLEKKWTSVIRLQKKVSRGVCVVIELGWAGRRVG